MELTGDFARSRRAGNHGGADGHVDWADWLDWFVSCVLDPVMQTRNGGSIFEIEQISSWTSVF
jgi:hypothetical protein